MSIGNYIGFRFIVGFGLWFLVFPMSVIRFYTWFHKGSGRCRSPWLFESSVRLGFFLSQ